MLFDNTYFREGLDDSELGEVCHKGVVVDLVLFYLRNCWSLLRLAGSRQRLLLSYILQQLILVKYMVSRVECPRPSLFG